MRKTLLFIMAICISNAVAQESKEVIKVDHFTSTENLNKASATHGQDLVAAHHAKLAEFAKSGVIILRGDTLISTDKPLKLCFSWPVSGGQGLDRSNVVREPKVMTVFPAKDANNKDVLQKWQISYKDGTVKAIP